jgi:hypothetical protein
MRELRVIVICHRCARLALRYVTALPPGDPDVISFAMPAGWRQRWDDDAQAFVFVCDPCASSNP